jgi:hypothetical protein
MDESDACIEGKRVNVMPGSPVGIYQLFNGTSASIFRAEWM